MSARYDGQLLAEAYPGELSMYRSLVRVLRLAARSGDAGEVARLLYEHQADDDAARAEASGKAGRADAISPGPGRVARLLDAIRTAGPGERWTTGRVLELYALTEPGPMPRVTARRDLAYLRWGGHLVQHGSQQDRSYSLKTRKDGRS